MTDTDDLAAITGQPFWKPCTICHTKGHTGYYDRRLGRHVNEPCDECDGAGYVRNTAPRDQTKEMLP